MLSARLSEPTLSAMPGGVVGCDLRLRNGGDSPVALRVVPRGRAGAWAVALPASVDVAPGAEAQARLTFTVPDADFVAGERVAFTVRVVGERPLDVPGTIEIAERRDVRLSVHPLISRDGRRGDHTVLVSNRGNVPALVTLGAEDEGDGATVSLASRVVVVEAGEEASVGLAVAARHRLVGRRPRAHRIAIWAEQDDRPRLETGAVLFQSPVRWKPVLAVLGGLAAMIAVVALAGSTGPSSEPAGRAAATPAAEVPSNCPAPDSDGGGQPVVPINAFAYCPADITVAAGSELIWRNEDLVPHTATADGFFDTGLLAQGQSATVRFDTPGTFAYFCKVHPAMRGTITVTG